MITLDAVEKVYRTARIETAALRNITIEIKPGEFVSIMGPSGSGKSTLLHVMGLLDAPTRGRVRVADKDVTGVADRALARLRNEHIGFVFQTFHLVGDLTVLDNVEIPLLYRSISRAERRRLALAALERVGLASRVRHYPGQLSGGQQQRVAIARAIVGRPRIVLADEPTGNLDSQMGDEIMGVLQDLNRREHTTVVMVTQDARQAEKTDRILRLFDGRQVN
ncbi:MAG TPA: ABC transporter ATP-binding protein [Kofleriaceae bacterium]|nr:ABC transporter ATP-binding protein [Kofleriaceae bacterium]